MFKSINPTNQEVLKEYPADTVSIIDKKISNGDTAYRFWSGLTFKQRANYFIRAAETLLNNKEKYATLITQEMGKPIKESRAEIEKCALVCEYYANNAADFLAPIDKEINSKIGRVAFQPIGVVFGIFPWNYPFWQVFRFAAPTLMAGNTGIFKHSPNVPQCAEAIEQVFIESGFPEKVFQNTFAEVEHTERIIGNNKVKAVTLTGSEKAGSSVAALAGKYIKKSVLELGGSDPFIVFPDADIDKAVAAGITSRYQNCGQSCIAAKRFIIHEDIKDTFLKKFVAAVQALKVGDPMDENTDVGPMARPDLRDKLQEQVDDTLKKGGHMFAGGLSVVSDGNFIAPALIVDVAKTARAYTEELFGPIASVYTFKTENQAIEIANATDFGLGGSVWTKADGVAHRIAGKIESGSVYINELVKSMPEMPFGGIKNSGYGRELSEFGIHEFVNTKTIFNY